MAKSISQSAFLHAVKTNNIAVVSHAVENGMSPNFEKNGGIGLLSGRSVAFSSNTRIKP
jgi:hypothetical protein